MSSTEKIEAQTRLIELADQIIHQKIDLATVIWEMSRHLSTLKLALEKDYLVFEAFRSETDHLPLPKHRQNWNPERYNEKAAELKIIESTYRDRVLQACSTLKAFLSRQQY